MERLREKEPGGDYRAAGVSSGSLIDSLIGHSNHAWPGRRPAP